MSESLHSFNVASLIPVPPSKNGLTSQVNLQQELSYLKKNKTYIFTDTQNPQNIEGCRVIPINNGVLFSLKVIRRAKKLNIDILNIHYIYTLYGFGSRIFKMQITSAFNILGLLIFCKFYGIKSVLTIHSVLSDIRKESTLDNYREQKFLNIFISIFNTLLFNLPNFIVTFSKFQLEALLNFTDARRLQIIPHGMNSGTVIKKEHEIFTFIYFGMIRPNKGILVLLAAFKQLSLIYGSIKLVIAGGYTLSPIGEYLNYYEKVKSRIAELVDSGLNVEFHDGWISDSKSLELISISDCVVLPYIDNANEVSGVVSSFAFAGVPFIVSDIIRFRSMLSEDEAILVPPGNPSALCEAMERIIVNTDLKIQLSHNIRKKASSYSWKVIAQQYMQLYEKIMVN